MEFYSAMKKNEIMLFAGKWMELKTIILSEIHQSKKAKYVFSHTRNLGLIKNKTKHETWYQWLTPVILATQEVEIGRIMVQSQSGQVVPKTLSQKNPSQKRSGGVAQGVGPGFKPQYHNK
jgi:hypothetical protein